jgi:hypothetical protein
MGRARGRPENKDGTIKTNLVCVTHNIYYLYKQLHVSANQIARGWLSDWPKHVAVCAYEKYMLCLTNCKLVLSQYLKQRRLTTLRKIHTNFGSKKQFETPKNKEMHVKTNLKETIWEGMV